MSTGHHEPSDEPPAKRQKLQTEIQRSTDFWFKTGNFVLVANQQVAYRVHGDVLGRSSTVFSDLLDLDEVPRPDSEATMDGCPVVHITDFPEYFDKFLHLLYDGFRHRGTDAQPPRWTMVRAMIVLGDKYDMPMIRREGLSQLRAWYAEDIDDWDQRDEAFFDHETDCLSVASLTHTLDDSDLHAAALYHCCQLSPSFLVAGDPTTGSPPLCTDDLIRSIKFMKNLPRAWSSALTVLKEQGDVFDSEGCAECTMSNFTLDAMVHCHVQAQIDSCASMFVDQDGWSPLSDHLDQFTCASCMSICTTTIEALRQSCRCRLVEYFECSPS